MKTHGTLEYAQPREDVSKRGCWRLRASPPVMIRVKRLFARANATRQGEILIWDTPEVARDLEWLLQRFPLKMKPEAAMHLGYHADKHRQTEQTIDAILTGQRPHLDLMEPARPARDYQLVAAELATATGGLLLADDVGLGKTMSSILVLRHPEALPALVVCLTHLPTQIEGEIHATLPGLKTHIVRKMLPYNPADMPSMKGKDPDVLIIPYSKLRGWGFHLAGRIKTIVFDEAQELRLSTSQKYRAAGQIADAARFRLGLTATPVYNYGGEIWSIMDIIAPGVLGSREEFGAEWCVSGHSEKARVKDPAALGVYLREQGVMLRRTRKEVGRELPDVIRVNHAIDIDDDVIMKTAGDANALAEMIVARSGTREELFRASGELDWKLRHATGVAKAPYVAEFVKMVLESDEKVVLFGWHRDVYEIWERALREYRPAFYTGTESPNQKRNARDSFITGGARVLVMSLRAGAGLDGLQQASRIAVFGELDWSPGMHDQCIGRLARDGMGDDPVVAYFLVADSGSDPVVAEVLGVKRQQSEPIRNPDMPLFEVADSTGDRVRRLAEDFLRRANGQMRLEP